MNNIQLDVDTCEKFQQQLALEEESVTLGIKHYRDIIFTTDMSDTGVGLRLLYNTMKPLIEAFHLFKMDEKNMGRLKDVKKLLHQFENEELAYITARRCINAISSTEPIQRIAISLANMLLDHLEYKTFKAEQPNYLYVVEKNLKTTQNMGHRRTVIMRAKRLAGVEDTKWNDVLKLHIGVKCIEIFIQCSGLVEKKLLGRQTILTGTPKIEKWIEEQHSVCELLNPLYMPMIMKPLDWISCYEGGFITIKHYLVKTRDKRALYDLNMHEMPDVYKAINAVQSTAWRINKRVLEVMREVWHEGTGIGGLPITNEESLPPKVWQSDMEFNMLKETQPEVVKAWKVKANKVYDRRLRLKSKRFATLQKLWLADKFKNELAIYFCWNMDWRGRMYPIQSFINPQADDTGKALIEFAEGLPLGADGVRWLHINLANHFGYDKVGFDERIQWVKNNEQAIIDSAVNPLDGSRFWCEADNPYLFLATCFEYADYKVQGDGYISHLPINLDGTCNGLQNFSAMLCDEVGGKATNLIPADKPADVYAEVAQVVSTVVKREAEAGDEMAKLWVGKIDRGMAKRNVMTVPYGAKQYGMKYQLMEELAERDTPDNKYLGVEDNFKPALYLAARMYEGIGTVVVAARNAMNWLQDVARIAAKANTPVWWTTPVGFMPNQKYIKQNIHKIDTYWGGVRLRMDLRVDTNKLDKAKQSNGISPNFVHSLDASHLMLTVNKCKDAAIGSFSLVHDSYGTHAANTDTLAYLLREAFIEQYSIDVLDKFKREVIEQLPIEIGKTIKPLPVKGNLDLQDVRNSRYFFA